MVYKRYIKRGNKIFGPYYCESYRDENGNVRTRFISGPKKRDFVLSRIKKLRLNFNLDKRTLLIISIILGIFLLLIIGNINYSYKSKTTGKIIEAQEGISFSASSTDIDTAEKIAKNEVKSNIDLTKNVKTKIKKPLFDNKILEFRTAEGKITLEFDLLNCSEWYMKTVENELKTENFDIRVNESTDRYKWGYSVKLKELNFMAKINVKHPGKIIVIDNQTIKIGNYYLSFLDLVQKNYTISINQPVIISEINLTANIISEINLTANLTINITEINLTANLTINITETLEEEPPAISSSIIKIMTGFFINGIKGIVGFVFRGVKGVTGLVVGGENYVSVYIQKDFTNSGVQIGDLVSLDPYLIGIMATRNGTAVDDAGNVYQCGTINASGTYTMNQSIMNNTLISACINIITQNVTLDCNGYYIKSDDTVSGVYSNQFSTAIKNCNITMAGSGHYMARGIELKGANNHYIFNNILNDQAYGLYLDSVSNSIIENNIANYNSYGGAYVINSSNINFKNDIFDFNREDGIVITSPFPLLYFTREYGTADTFPYSPYPYPYNNTFPYSPYLYSYNNTFTNIITNNNKRGISLYLSSNNVFTNITANSNTYEGISFLGVYNSILTDAVLNSNKRNGIFLSSASNNTFQNLSLWNCSSGSESYSGCINLNLNSKNNIFKNIFINNSLGKGIFFDGYYQPWTIENNLFQDVKLENITEYDVYLLRSSINNTFLNATYNLSKESVASGSSLTRKWYYRAQVVDSQSSPVADATIYAYNNNNDLTLNLTTNGSGWTPIGQLIDYVNSEGIRSYYSVYVLIPKANQTLKLKAEHRWNVTEKQNNLTGLFELENDFTLPVLSVSAWTANAYDATITWTTGEGCNASVIYGTGLELSNGSSGKSGFGTSHSITITGLSNNTTYYYNYTSCDFVGNCNTSSGSFKTAVPGQQSISNETVSICTPYYFECEDWQPICDKEYDGQLQTRTCIDINLCWRIDSSIVAEITETRTCSVSKESEEPTPPVETPMFGGGTGATRGCNSVWECGGWSNCKIVYRSDDLLEGNTFLQGEQSRICEDLGKCFYNKIERKKCDTKIPVNVKKLEKCFKKYTEIRDENGTLISRLEIVNETLKKLNIQMLIETEYCPYCYDGQLNYDEDEIDCVYEGDSCPLCREEELLLKKPYSIVLEEKPLLKKPYSIVLILLVVSSVLLFILMVFYLVLLRERKKIVRKNRGSRRLKEENEKTN